MTRLDAQMPYDADRGASDQLNLLLSDVKRAFTDRIGEARNQEVDDDALSKLARDTMSRSATLITFNYDDILDAELYRAGQVDQRRWSPDAGYGFVSGPSLSCVRGGYDSGYHTAEAPLLLKLHGSMNWRTKLGYSSPYSIDAIVHDEEWFQTPGSFDEKTLVQLHLQPDPLIVPPVLTKADLSLQPALRLVWSLAYQALSMANRVVFVGYSMPATDIAAKVLFKESASGRADIRVVNLATEQDDRNRLTAAYRFVFPNLTEDRFDFDGASAWAERLAAGQMF
jgi:hypothetical protein